MKKIMNGPQKKQQLHALLEGYLYGLGEVCHALFGSKGELAMYSAIGNYFLSYLKRHMGIAFLEQDPWERLCHIIGVFTSYGYIEDGHWIGHDQYFKKNYDAKFSHSICPVCYEKLYHKLWFG